MHRKLLLIFLMSCSISVWSTDTAKLQVFRTGNSADVVTKTTAGFALMGGGKDLDEAFKFLCDKSGLQFLHRGTVQAELGDNAAHGKP